MLLLDYNSLVHKKNKMLKLLVVDLKNPEQTKYQDPKKIGAFMLGRKFSGYSMYGVDEDGTMTPIKITSINDVMDLQYEVMEQLGYSNEFTKIQEIRIKIINQLQSFANNLWDCGLNVQGRKLDKILSELSEILDKEDVSNRH